jgi:hypothetical protein
MVADGTGNVVVTGTSATNGGGSAYTTIKYSSAGAQLWINRYNGPSGGDSAHAVAVDGSGNVFVTGSSTSASGTYSDFATLAYSSAGVPFWTNRYNGPGHGYDMAAAMAVDSSGNVFVTGRSLGNGTSVDYATIKYSSSIPQPVLPPQLTILSDGGAGYVISAQGAPNFTCQLQRASILTGPWSTSVSQTGNASGLVQFHDLFPPPGRAFYRTVQQSAR